MVEPMKSIDEIKMNVSQGKAIEDCSYNNFLEIACHVAVKAVVRSYRNGFYTKERVVEEYNIVAKWYEHFSKAYMAEREIYDKQSTSMSKALTDLNAVNLARTPREAFDSALSALRAVFGDSTIGSRFDKKE